MLNTSKVKQNPQLKTLAIDIGGTGVKMIVLDARGKPVNERLRLPTPDPATPEAVLALIEQMKEKMTEFDRVSIGFPGVIKGGKTMTAHNLNPDGLISLSRRQSRKNGTFPLAFATMPPSRASALFRAEGWSWC